MENNDKYGLTVPRPRKPTPPPAMPPPPPFPIRPKKPIININVNGGDKAIDYAVLSALQVLYKKVDDLEEIVGSGGYFPSGYVPIELGEVSGTAYPGDKGHANAIAISLISQAMQNLVTKTELSIFKDELNEALDDRLLAYATIQAVTQNIEELQYEFNKDIEQAYVDLSCNVSEAVVSTIVSSMLSSYVPSGGTSGDEEYYPIISGIDDLIQDITG